MKIIARVITLAVLLCLFSGCGRRSNYDDMSSGVEDDAMAREDDNVEDDAEDDAESPEYAYASQQKMEGNVVIRPECMLLLKNDGTVVGKGNSEHGELGNGERTGSESWTPVSGLTDVKKIYADEAFGTLDNSLYGDKAFCYALTKDGDLYKWGGNILEPICLLSDVDAFSWGGNGSDAYLVEDRNKNKKILTSRHIFDITKIVGKSEILFADGDFLILKDSESHMSYYITFDIEDGKQIDEVHEFYHARGKEHARYKMSKDIERVAFWDYNSVHVLSKEGAVCHFSFDDDRQSITSEGKWSGKGYKYYFKINSRDEEGGNRFGLLVDEVNTMGENKYGQLGDGTNLDYWDDWITVDEFRGVELYVGRDDHDPYCVALDEDCNIWCWGKGFGSTPQIRVGQTEDGDEDIDIDMDTDAEDY